jgi:hypothetical protein
MILFGPTEDQLAESLRLDSRLGGEERKDILTPEQR